MATGKCCLCLKSVESTTDKKTRKYFHGTSCASERVILSRVTKRNNSQLNISSFEELSDTDALLCAKCSRLLLRVQRLEDEFATSTMAIQKHLTLLHRHYSGTTSHIAPRKRLLSEPGSETSNEEMLSMQEEEAVVSGMENTGNPGDAQACSNQCPASSSASPDVIVSLYIYIYICASICINICV